jgi:tetratricopeptide (TPR) repeat protein
MRQTLRILLTYKRILTACLCFIIAHSAWTQTPADAQRWRQQLAQTTFDSASNTALIWTEWMAAPAPNYAQNAVRLLENAIGQGASKSLDLQLALLKARLVLDNKSQYEGKNTEGWCKGAVQQAIETGDDYLLFDACHFLGYAYLQMQNNEAGLFYFLKAIELAEKNKMKRASIQNMKIFVASYLYTTHNYSTVIAFCKDVLDYPVNDLLDDNYIGLNNDLALAFRATAQYDSAIFYFKKVIERAQKNNLGAWVGIASGNIGDVYSMMGKPDLAVPLWKMDIDSCLAYHETENLGLTMLFLSEYLFEKGDKTLAISYLEKAAAIPFKKKQNRLLFYKIKGMALKASGKMDEAYVYLTKYQVLNDSINLDIAQSSYEKVKLKLDFESNAHQFNLLQAQRKTEITRRNFLIIGLIITLILAWLLMARLRLRHKLAENQKTLAESEVVSAKAQLLLFTDILLTKNEQIDALNAQIHTIQRGNEDELVNQTILTDDDWNRFRQLFEKANPGFFDKIKQLAPDITAAELRLAALIKLQLDTKQMASMQGISPVSIRSNKSRLRQRLQVSSETDLEEFIKNQ